MRYSLWSRGRLVGHTHLDVHTVTPTMRQGFVEPSQEGPPLLADATGVWRALAEVKRGSRARGEPAPSDSTLVLAAMDRREELALELRDEKGNVVECDHIQIYDLFDLEAGVVDEMSDTEEEEEAAFQIRLSALAGEARDNALARRAEADAEIDAMVADILEERNERTMFDSTPAPPEDPRWKTMQYLLQMHIKGNEWDDESSSSDQMCRCSHK